MPRNFLRDLAPFILILFFSLQFSLFYDGSPPAAIGDAFLLPVYVAVHAAGRKEKNGDSAPFVKLVGFKLKRKPWLAVSRDSVGICHSKGPKSG